MNGRGPKRGRLRGILERRCPVCLEGRMFVGWRMMDRCGVCGHRFMREPGFFQGAMYVSYVVGVVEFLLFGIGAILLLGSRLGTPSALGIAAAVHLALVPALYQYSRVIWAHLSAGTGAEAGR